MNQWFSIGEMARHQNISRQTLIFYDKIGLLRPAWVDPDNGYRYYSAAQLDQLDTILIMKKVGFSLEEIREHMAHYNLRSSLAALKKQQAVIDRQIRELQIIKSRVEHRCRQMEIAAALRERGEAVTVEQVPVRYLLLQPVQPPRTLQEISLATKQCFVRAFQEALPVFYQSGAIVPYDRIRQGRYIEASHAFLPMEKKEGEPGVLKLPAGTAVCTCHLGDYLSIGPAYERLLAYCEEKGLKIVSDSYEYALNDYLSTGDEAEYITRIELYVEPEEG